MGTVTGGPAAAGDVTEGPRLLMRGRFALSEMGDGSWVIRYTSGLEDDAEQQTPLVVPAMLVGLLKARNSGERIGVAQLRKLMAMALGGLGGEQEAPGDD